MRRNTSSQIAYDRLKEMIADQELLPGEQIVEMNIAVMLNCSRTPVREAIRMLQDDGLVDIIPNRGSFLKKVTKLDVVMAFEIAEALEGMACYLVAERVRNGELLPADFNELEQCLARMTQCMSQKRVKDWAAYDDCFHILLVELSGNRMIMQERKRAMEQINQVLWFVTPTAINKDLSNLEHIEITKAIRSGQSEQARIWGQAHRHRVREELKQML